MKRTKDDNCLLCINEKSIETNSHLVPAGLIKSMVGKRYYEESYSIDVNKIEIDVYYGRSNLKNSNPEIKENHYSRDFWFCKNCEKRLGEVENIALPIINNDLRNENKSQNFEKIVTESNITIWKNKKLNQKVFQLFIFSLIWRLALLYRLENDTVIFSELEEDKLRTILNKYLTLDIKSLKQEQLPFELPYFKVITSKQLNVQNINWVYTENVYKNPNIFFLNEIIVMYFPSKKIDIETEYDLELNDVIIEGELMNHSNTIPSIGFIENERWNKTIEKLRKTIAKIIFDKLALSIQNVSGKSLEICKAEIVKNAENLYNESSKSYLSCCKEVTRNIILAYKEIYNLK